MTARTMFRPLIVGCLAMVCAGTAHPAAAATADALKATIETFLHRVEASSAGKLHWDGADTFDVQTSGDTATATLVNVHFSFRNEANDPKPVATLTLDHIEISRKPSAQGGNLDEIAISVPPLSTLVTDQGREIALTIKEGQATALLEGPDDRQRAGTLVFSSARIEDKGGKSWAGFGPFTSDWKMVRNDDGSWRSPLDFELKGLEFLIAEAPLAGAVERIAYTGEATGPNFAELDALRDRLNEINQQHGDPAESSKALLPLLPKFLAVFSSSKGDLTIERISTKRPDGETLVTLAKATMDGSITGLAGDNAAVRMTLSHEGLTIAPSLVAAARVPRRAVLDLGFEKIAVSALRTLAEAAAKNGAGASDADRQAATQQMIGAVMSLNPVFRLYDASVEFPDVGIDATGEAQRAPPAPIGYAATGDVTVHGFDALPELLTGHFEQELMPLLKFIGSPGADSDSHPVTKFAIASAIGRPIVVNNSNLANWFAAIVSAAPSPGAPARLLRLADPPLAGDDVRAVQRAVAVQQVEPFTEGVYDTATALAVARFQKQAGINVDGTVDEKTREALGIKPPLKPIPLAPGAGAPPKN
jgi:hypothetical protein